MKYILETKNLTKSYGKKTIISGINLGLAPGEIFALLGLNGAGKTTTIKMLLGLINPSMGQIRYMNKNFQTSKTEVLPRIGSVLENPGFYDNLSVYKNLKLIQNIVGVHESNNIDEVLSIIGMDAFKYEKVKNLNASHRQKLALCRALLNSPDLLILDEPMNGLDPKSVNEIRTLLKRLSKEKNMTIFISSHVLSEVEKLADTIGFLSQGALVKTIDIKTAFMKKVDRLFMTVSNSFYGMEILKLNGYECFESKAERLVIYADESDVNKILKLMVAHDIGVEEVYFKPQDLEDMFMELVEK